MAQSETASQTHDNPVGRYAGMTAWQVALAVEQLLAQYAAEDAARRARNAAILAAFGPDDSTTIH